MKDPLLAVAAAGEAATGLALLVVPTLVVRLLVGAQIAGAGIVMSRVAGIALIALGVGCWPGNTASTGMLTYSTLATLYMAFLGVSGEWVGVLLWPGVIYHAILTILLARERFGERKSAVTRKSA